MDVDDVVGVERVRGLEAIGWVVGEEVREGDEGAEGREVDPAGRVLYDDEVAEGGYALGLEGLTGEIGGDLLEQGDIGSRGFSWEIGLGADDEVRSFEMVERRDDLGGVEGRV